MHYDNEIYSVNVLYTFLKTFLFLFYFFLSNYVYCCVSFCWFWGKMWIISALGHSQRVLTTKTACVYWFLLTLCVLLMFSCEIVACNHCSCTWERRFIPFTGSDTARPVVSENRRSGSERGCHCLWWASQCSIMGCHQ